MPLSTVLGAQSLVQPAVCTTATRPASPYTGQAIYDTTVSQVLVYNGTAFAPVSRVLQVVSTAKTDSFTSTSTSFADVTGLSVSITPTVNTNKILVFAQVSGIDDYAVSDGYMNLVRDSTNLDIGDTAGSRISVSGYFNSAGNNGLNNLGLVFLDSPATTSATTYKIQVKTNSGTVYVNRTKSDTNASSTPRAASTITVMEISA